MFRKLPGTLLIMAGVVLLASVLMPAVFAIPIPLDMICVHAHAVPPSNTSNPPTLGGCRTNPMTGVCGPDGFQPPCGNNAVDSIVPGDCPTVTYKSRCVGAPPVNVP